MRELVSPSKYLQEMEYYSSLDASKLDSETPTLFELISSNQLEQLLSPSLRYVLVHYALRYPGYLLKLANNFDELNLLIRSIVEWYFFKYWRGSFTENFYGLKRVSQTPLSKKRYNSSKLTQLVPSLIEERRILSTTQTAVSIFEITGLSYLQEKCNYHYELLYSKLITNQLRSAPDASASERRKVWLQSLFIKVYPYVQNIWRLSNLATTLAFMSGATKSPLLLMLLFKMNYSRLNQYDYSRNEPQLKSKKTVPNRVRPPNSSAKVLKYIYEVFVKPSLRSAKFLLGTFFPLAIFTLKFLEWWNSSDFAQKVVKSLRNDLEDSIPPPSVLMKMPSLNQKKVSLYKSGSSCPLCREQIMNPAIIETGYVFCYTCIYNYLRDSHKIAHRTRDFEKQDKYDSASESLDEDETSEEPKNSGKGSPSAAKSDVNTDKGGRCPVTGQKLLGCRWNEISGEFDVDGIRRLIF